MGLGGKWVIVERNGEPVERRHLSTTILAEGDRSSWCGPSPADDAPPTGARRPPPLPLHRRPARPGRVPRRLHRRRRRPRAAPRQAPRRPAAAGPGPAGGGRVPRPRRALHPQRPARPGPRVRGRRRPRRPGRRPAGPGPPHPRPRRHRRASPPTPRPSSTPPPASRSTTCRPVPVSPTPTKPGRPGTGLGYLRYAAANATRPWFVTGGVTPDTVGDMVAPAPAASSWCGG